MLKIELNSGRIISLESMWQHHTYSGLLLGVPNKEMNDRYIKSNLKYALEKMNPPTTYLVPPPLLKVENIDTSIQRYADAIRLPYITCFAEFESSVLEGDTTNHASFLTIVWYQDDFVMPIDTSVLEHIKTIDWDKEAKGFLF